ncbi:hypothetical protein B0H19DRAFT_1182823 [Mycena capillaripes]|nr:hypothetical protein B0H19DRAFT_1182823 [Mycena capillaripes]
MSMSPPFPSFAFVQYVVPVLTTFCGLKGLIRTPTPDRYTFFCAIYNKPPVAEEPVRRHLVGAVSFTEHQTSTSRQCSSQRNTGTVDFDMMTLKQ